MAMAAGTKGLRSSINITPYIDILLTLLVIFMVIAPVHQMDLRVKVPEPAPAKEEKAPATGAIVLSMTGSDRITINRQPVSIETLKSKLEEIYNSRADKSMFISASPELPYGDVVHVIDIAKGAGVGDIGLLTKQLSNG